MDIKSENLITNTLKHLQNVDSWEVIAETQKPKTNLTIDETLMKSFVKFIKDKNLLNSKNEFLLEENAFETFFEYYYKLKKNIKTEIQNNLIYKAHLNYVKTLNHIIKVNYKNKEGPDYLIYNITLS